MKQELIKHLNNIEHLVQKNYITLEVIKNFCENCDGGFESSQKTLIILRDMIKQQKSVLNGFNTFIASLKEQK